MKSLAALIEKQKAAGRQDLAEVKVALETFQQTYRDKYQFPDFPDVPVRVAVVQWLLALVDDAAAADVHGLALDAIKTITRSRDGLAPLTELKALQSILTRAEESKTDNAKVAVACTIQNVLFLSLTSNPSYKEPTFAAIRAGQLYKRVIAMWTAVQNFDVKINCQRVLDHLSYTDTEITVAMLNEEKLLGPLIATFLAHCGDMKTFVSATDLGNQQRVVCTHALRLLVKLFLFIVEHEERPNGRVKFDKSHIGAANYDLFCARLVTLLGHGAAPPPNPFGLPLPGPQQNAAAGAVQPAAGAGAGAAAASAPAAAAKPNDTDTKGAAPPAAPAAAAAAAPPAEADSKTGAAAASAAAAAGSGEGKTHGPARPPLPPPPVIEEDEPSPSRASMWSVKEAIAQLLLALPKSLVPEVMRMGTPHSMQGLVDLLRRQTIRALKSKSEADAHLPPICIALTNIARGSAEARLYLKVAVFGKYATNKERHSDNMLPAGALNPHEVDTDPYSIKSVLLAQLTSFSGKLKTSVSEFLYQLCNSESDEYIRLCGFGAAAGLLADKGFPGLAGLKAQAIDLDALVAAKQQRDQDKAKKS